MNEIQTKPPRKPYFVSDAEWAEALHASHVSLLNYIFPSRRVVFAFLSLFISLFYAELHSSHWDFTLGLSHTFHSNAFVGLAFFLFVGVISRDLDWRSKRKLVFRKPADAENHSMT